MSDDVPPDTTERRSIVLSDSQFGELRSDQVDVMRKLVDHVTDEMSWRVGMTDDIADMREQIDALATQQNLLELEVRGVVSGHRYVVDQMLELNGTVGRQAESTRRLEAGLDANTKLTTELVAITKGISDILATGRVASGFAQWLGSMSKPLVSAAVLFGGAVAVSKGLVLDMWQTAVNLWQSIVR